MPRLTAGAYSRIMKLNSLLILDRGRLRVERVESFREHPAREETCCRNVLDQHESD